MGAAEILEARARAELEMFYQLTVEEGVLLLASMARSSGLQESSEGSTRPESQAQSATGRRGESSGHD